MCSRRYQQNQYVTDGGRSNLGVCKGLIIVQVLVNIGKYTEEQKAEKDFCQICIVTFFPLMIDR